MLTENVLWAWNVDIFVRLDLRGWPPPLLHNTTLTTAWTSSSLSRVTRYYDQGRLNQWAHWARAQGPLDFFSFWGVPSWLWWNNFFGFFGNHASTPPLSFLQAGCIQPVENWVVGCWRGYLSGAWCRLAYAAAASVDWDATSALLHLYQQATSCALWCDLITLNRICSLMGDFVVSQLKWRQNLNFF